MFMLWCPYSYGQSPVYDKADRTQENWLSHILSLKYIPIFCHFTTLTCVASYHQWLMMILKGCRRHVAQLNKVSGTVSRNMSFNFPQNGIQPIEFQFSSKLYPPAWC